VQINNNENGWGAKKTRQIRKSSGHYVEIWLILLAIGFAALGLAQSQSSIV